EKIIDAAVELFGTVGFGETGLADIISRADVTKGSFYYHFDSKEAVAAAIIDKSEQEFRQSTIQVLSSPSSPALDNLIRSTFSVVHMHEHDTLTRVANQLRQSLAQVSPTGSTTYLGRQAVVFTVMTDAIKRGIADGDIADDIDVDGLARTIWAASLGNRVLADALGDDIFAQLVQMWRVLLRAIAPTQSLSYFGELVNRMAQQYAHHIASPGDT
ncbi:MAG: TetR/AcrR family transcriptional regulator, partial [Nocardiaceae bacterium]|nr:TetR/AcrR family transcriptional regulator [Nocardiaceae bacterium]